MAVGGEAGVEGEVGFGVGEEWEDGGGGGVREGEGCEEVGGGLGLGDGVFGFWGGCHGVWVVFV